MFHTRPNRGFAARISTAVGRDSSTVHFTPNSASTANPPRICIWKRCFESEAASTASMVRNLGAASGFTARIIVRTAFATEAGSMAVRNTSVPPLRIVALFKEWPDLQSDCRECAQHIKSAVRKIDHTEQPEDHGQA